MKMDVKLSRRQFLKGAVIAGAGMALPLKFGVRDSYASICKTLRPLLPLP
jgi:hypothetical protein